VGALNVVTEGKGNSWKKWVWIALAALAAIQIYFVREMLAVLFLFTILFIVVTVIVLVLWLLDRASQRTVAWAEPQTKQLGGQLGRLARKGFTAVEERSRKWTHTGDAHP
jgi:Flp pilus assembly protein TadB